MLSFDPINNLVWFTSLLKIFMGLALVHFQKKIAVNSFSHYVLFFFSFDFTQKFWPQKVFLDIKLASLIQGIALLMLFQFTTTGFWKWRSVGESLMESRRCFCFFFSFSLIYTMQWGHKSFWLREFSLMAKLLLRSKE